MTSIRPFAKQILYRPPYESVRIMNEIIKFTEKAEWV
jgi:hypothetical protein